MKTARDRMDMIATYNNLGSYRGAAAILGVDPKTVKRAVTGEQPTTSPGRAARRHNYDVVAEIVAARVAKTSGRISAKRLLPEARAAGYDGSARNFRRLVAAAKRDHRAGQHRGRRPAVWSPGETLVIDWGVEAGLHVFCAVLAWTRYRFVRLADDERQETALGLLAECFEELGGVPKVVLADRMGCLKAAVVADVVVPSPDYVRFATHFGFRPDFCQGYDPASKGIVENLVGYAKSDLVLPAEPDPSRLHEANDKARSWCDEVNAALYSEICAVPAERLMRERELLGPLPSLRPRIGKPTIRKVDRLSCVRIGGGGRRGMGSARSRFLSAPAPRSFADERRGVRRLPRGCRAPPAGRRVGCGTRAIPDPGTPRTAGTGRPFARCAAHGGCKRRHGDVRCACTVGRRSRTRRCSAARCALVEKVAGRHPAGCLGDARGVGDGCTTVS